MCKAFGRGTAGCGASVGNGVSMLREDRALNGSHGPDSAATGRKAAGIVSVCGLTNNESGASAPVSSGGLYAEFRTGDERRDKPRLRPVKTDSPSRNGSGNRGFVRYAESYRPSVAIRSFSALILASASFCLARSFSTTCAGAFCTKRSLPSFFRTEARKPS